MESKIICNRPLVLTQPNYFKEWSGIELEKFIDKYEYSVQLSEPQLYYFLDFNTNSLFHFLLHPGETYQVLYDTDGSTFFTPGNQAEAKLYWDLKKNNASVLYQFDGYDPNDSFGSGVFTNSTKALKIGKETNHKRDSILAVHKSALKLENYNFFKNAIWLKRLVFLTEPFNSTSPKPNFSPEIEAKEFFEEIEILVKRISTLDSTELNSYSFWLSYIYTNYSNLKARELSESEKFEFKFYEVSKIFKGKAKESYLTSILLEESKLNSIDEHILNDYFLICKNEDFIGLVNRSIQNSSFWDNPELQNCSLVKDDGTYTSWKDLLASKKGKLIYIDFWASWCVGCKQNLPDVVQMKNNFPELEIIFISKDKEKEKWISSMESWEFPNSGSHYLIDPETKLAKILTNPTIPRATLINKENNVITINAFHPNSPNLIKTLKKYY